MGLYVEAHIQGDLDELWARTQDPAQHRRWDVRLTEIDCMPGAEGEPRRFRYATRVLPFLTVRGTGVSAGERTRPDGTRTSALRFSSPHPLSPIAEGGGYWRYVPDGDGVRFLAGCDYRPRWGAFGRLADRLLLRRLMGWATAWSFDRLRLWVERGVTPERALANWCAELAVRGLVVTVACTGLGLRSLIRLFGPFAATMAYLCPLLLTLAISVALFKEPLAGTPAARRCLRTPPTRVGAPRLLAALERPS
ncbi:SRPBCC family protein [Streptomyces sp. NPDC002519]